MGHASRKHQGKQGIKAVPADYLGTETMPVPEAYESPHKAYSDLENRLLILTDKAPVKATEMVGALLEDNENHPGVNNVRRGEIDLLGHRLRTVIRRNATSVASSSMKRSKSARGSVKSGTSSKNGSSVKSWRDSSSTLDKGTRKSLNQQTQINENLRRKEILQRKEKMNKIPEACHARVVRAAYAVRTLDDDQIKEHQRSQKTTGRRIRCWTTWKLNKKGKLDERSVHLVQVLLEEENAS